jgi:hypothetical protein
MNKLIIYITLLILPSILIAENNINSNNKYAWSNTSGWIDFNPNHGGVTVFQDHLEGYAWSETIGWIKLNNVINDGQGNLSGSGWNPNFGSIIFKSDHSQVTINLETGDFNGYAWSESIGWISFNGKSYKVQMKLPEPPPPENEIPPEDPEKPLDSFGQAIIIAAGGSDNNPLYKLTNEYTQRFYRFLKKRGFEDQEIAYMNPQAPDIDLDLRLENELLDYEFFDPEAELKTAFQQAANNLKAGQQFIFFLHGHARPNHFLIMNNYELSATYLRDLLAMLPSDTQQIIILDSCYSGSFFDELNQQGRILISSADNQNEAWNTKHESFTNTFIINLRRGETLKQSFTKAEKMIINEEKLFGKQRPWLDDDGDGLYSKRDGRTAATIQLGKQGFNAAPPPTIYEVHPRIELEPNITEANLWVRTTPGVEAIHKVRAILINPQFSNEEYKGIETNFGREELELIYNQVQKRYGIIYQGFKTPGMWRILYQAQNKEGAWSDIIQGEVQSQGTDKAAIIKMQLNQSRYKITEPLRLNAIINGQTQADLYIAIILPTGNFITFTYPSTPSWPNDAEVYKADLKIEGKKTYQINLNLAKTSPQGKYQTCGVLVQQAAKPLQLENWIDISCAEFEVY